MEQQAFIDGDVSWLTLEEPADSETKAWLDQITIYNGAADWVEWYKNPVRREKFYEGVLANNTQLASQFDELQDNGQYAQWLEQAVEAMFGDMEYDANYEMWYRLNNITAEYWWFYSGQENPQAPPASITSGEWMDQSAANQLMTDWQAQQAPEAQVTGATETEKTWDSAWNMYYRIGADGAYEYAFSATGADGGEVLTETDQEKWYKYEDVPDAPPVPAAEVPVEAAAVFQPVDLNPQQQVAVNALIEQASSRSEFQGVPAEMLENRFGELLKEYA
ncbi:MAG TPA: hypothetical protein VHY58_12200 [Streptosporangiaceae bacterium]|jgi:hypothetical protein|nr:hypothetical protein [Streptosporangiaceae bacterium]